MTPMPKQILALTAVFTFIATMWAQDSPSLGDVARRERQQKQETEAARGKNAKPPKVITNEQLPGHAPSTATPVASSAPHGLSTPASSDGPKQSAEQWRSQIQAQKGQVESLQKEINELNASIQFAPGNCVEGCVQWNQHQLEKQQQVQRMQGQLEEEKRRLEQMQDAARKQGYGSSVYDP